MNKRFSIIICLLMFFTFGCATHKAAHQPNLSFDLKAQENQINQDGISYMVKCFYLKSDLDTYFDDDILKYGILPVQINLQNKHYPRPVILNTDGINLINSTGVRFPMLSCEQVMEKIKKSYWRTAGWGVAFGLLGVIPSAINVSNTNKKIRSDYESRMIKSGNLVCGGMTEGLCFFSVPEDLDNLSGWQVSTVLKDIQEEKSIIVRYGLSGTVIPPKERKQEPEESSEESIADE